MTTIQVPMNFPFEKAATLFRPPADSELEVEETVRRWGRSAVSPFHTEPGRTVLRLAGGGVAGYEPVGRWAVFPTGIVAPPGFESDALDSLVEQVRSAGRRPVFAALPDPIPYETRGMQATRIADDAQIDLSTFSLTGKRMASLRHSITSARRAGLQIVPFSDALGRGVAAVSDEWLSTKRGGEMGFTLGRFDPNATRAVECRVAINDAGEVAGFVTWRSYDDGHARVLDIMRRSVDAPNPTMDLLIGESLLEFAAAGIRHASLGAVPLSHGSVSERVYPTVSLRRYKEKFAPTWEPLWLVAPSLLRTPGALMAVASAYCPGGIRQALRRNG